MRFKKYFPLIIMAAVSTVLYNCGKTESEIMEQEFKDFLKEYEAKIIPLDKEANLAYFSATISGKEEEFKKCADIEVKKNKIYANKEDFALLKRIKGSNAIKDPILSRQLDIIYDLYLARQIDEKKLEEIIRLGNAIENTYSTFRASIDGKKMTDNEIEDILKNSKDSKMLEKAWNASKKIGDVVAKDVIALVKMRNDAAKELGFKNYHEMSLSLGEQSPAEIEKLFDELDNLTREAFMELKNEIDDYLSKRLSIPKDKLRPWHYQNRYFQEAPKIYNVDLDGYYKDKDIVKLTADYYSGVGLPIDDLVSNSDLYEKEGKYQHAYCMSVDRSGDVRVVCNIKPNANWMNTNLHEFGHAVYDKFIDRDLPWQLREPAHTFTTEAIAMLFGRMASNPQWLKDLVGVSDEIKNKISEEAFKSLKLEQLVFSRWTQVMYRFEKAMYEDPEQDLNKLWWDLVEKYQMLKRPENRNAPDWASKIHVALYPAYYHNYLLGELLASQLVYYIKDSVLKTQKTELSFHNEKKVGEFLIEKVFKPGARYSWNEMLEKAVGEKLTPKYYAKQFVN